MYPTDSQLKPTTVVPIRRASLMPRYEKTWSKLQGTCAGLLVLAFDPFTNGYYEVASDGGIFAFGAPFQGSTGALALNKPVVGMSVG